MKVLKMAEASKKRVDGLKPPQSFTPGTAPATEWKKWKKTFDLYAKATGLEHKDK